MFDRLYQGVSAALTARGIANSVQGKTAEGKMGSRPATPDSPDSIQSSSISEVAIDIFTDSKKNFEQGRWVLGGKALSDLKDQVDILSHRKDKPADGHSESYKELAYMKDVCKSILTYDSVQDNNEFRANVENFMHQVDLALQTREMVGETVDELVLLAKDGDGDAINELAKLFENGKVSEQHSAELKEFGINPGLKPEARALILFRAAADKGSVDASYNLGRLLKESNPRESVRHFQKAGAAGHIQAKYELGCCFRDGVGISPQLSIAFHRFLEAANAGNMEAKEAFCKLHAMCNKDAPVPQGLDAESFKNQQEDLRRDFNPQASNLKNWRGETLEWLMERAEAGDSDAGSRLAAVADTTYRPAASPNQSSPAKEVAKPTHEEIEAILQKANNLDPQALIKLASLYEKELIPPPYTPQIQVGTIGRFQRAYEDIPLLLYKEAESQEKINGTGNGAAAYHVGRCIHSRIISGKGQEKHLEAAQQYYKAAQAGNLEAKEAFCNFYKMCTDEKLPKDVQDGLATFYFAHYRELLDWQEDVITLLSDPAYQEKHVDYETRLQAIHDMPGLITPTARAAPRPGETVVHKLPEQTASPELEIAAAVKEKAGLQAPRKEVINEILERANNGDPVALNNLALIYEHDHGNAELTSKISDKLLGRVGRGSMSNQEIAVELYKEAERKGNVNASFHLGRCMREGIGFKNPQPREAARKFKEAADKGHIEAKYELGRCLMDGVLGQPQLYLAYNNFMSAARAGNNNAKAKIKSLYDMSKSGTPPEGMDQDQFNLQKGQLSQQLKIDGKEIESWNV